MDTVTKIATSNFLSLDKCLIVYDKINGTKKLKSAEAAIIGMNTFHDPYSHFCNI